MGPQTRTSASPSASTACSLTSKTRAKSVLLDRSDCHICYTVFRGGSDGTNRNRRTRPVLGLGFQAADENTPLRWGHLGSHRLELLYVWDHRCRMQNASTRERPGGSPEVCGSCSFLQDSGECPLHDITPAIFSVARHRAARALSRAHHTQHCASPLQHEPYFSRLQPPAARFLTPLVACACATVPQTTN